MYSKEQYELDEVRRLNKELWALEGHSISDKKADYSVALEHATSNPKLIIERMAWLANGSYGFGAYHVLRQLSTRSNRAAWLFITTMGLEWKLPNYYARKLWGVLRNKHADTAKAISEGITDILKDIDSELTENNRAC